VIVEYSDMWEKYWVIYVGVKNQSELLLEFNECLFSICEFSLQEQLSWNELISLIERWAYTLGNHRAWHRNPVIS
jgi:hypothetical protein